MRAFLCRRELDGHVLFTAAVHERMEQAGDLVLFRVQLGGGAQRGVRQSVMPRELPHVESLEAGHGFAVMKELASPEQFVKDVFRFPRARQSMFRVGDADDQRPAVPAEVDAGSGHDVRGGLAGDAAQQQHAVVYQMDAAGAGFLLHMQDAAVNAGGRVAGEFFNPHQAVPDDEFRALRRQIHFRGEEPAVRHGDSAFMFPGALNAPLAHQKAAAVDFQAAVGLVPQENGHMVRQVSQERHGASVPDDEVGGAVPVVRLIGAANVNGGVDDVKISAGINGKGILNVRLALHHIIADGDRAHVGDPVHG